MSSSATARYRKKPVVIEAEQWLLNRNGKLRAPSKSCYQQSSTHSGAPASVLRQMSAGWQIQTMEGWLDLTPGDWIIRSVASL